MPVRATDLSRRLRAPLAACIVFGIAINLLYLAVPIYFIQVYNRVLSSHSLETLTALTAIVVLAIAAIAVLDAARILVVRRLGEAVDLTLFETLQKTGRDLAGRMTPPSSKTLAELDRVVRFFAPGGFIALFDLLWALIYSVVLFLLHPLLGGIAFTGSLVVAAMALASRPRDAETRQSAEAGRRAAGLRRWEGREQRALALGLWDGLAADRRAAREQLARHQARPQDRHAIGGAAVRGFRLLVLCATIAGGAWLVIGDQLGPATMFAASLLVARALAPIQGGVAAASELRHVRAAWGRIVQAEPPSVPGTFLVGRILDRTRGLELDRVTYRPAGAVQPVLANLSFSTGPGEVLGVLGPCGAGKTILAELISGALQPSAGRARFGGVDVTALHGSRAARAIGYLPQDRDLAEGTIAEAIAAGSGDAPETIVEAAAMAGLARYADALPEGLDTPLGKGLALPQGLLQQIALARAIRGQPLLVVLDEPTIHLDSEAERALIAAIGTLRARGSSVVVTSHRVSVLGVADKLLILRGGRLEMLGAKAEVLEALARRSVHPVPRSIQHARG